MSLFLPSNLSPNFQEVVSNIQDGYNNFATANIDFQFQVNSNGSCVRSYKLEILNGRNDADTSDDNILATFYGIFDKPLHNKDIHTITLTDNQINEQMTLEIPKDYRWRLRLYEDIISLNNDIVDIQTVYGNTYVGAGHTVGTTKNVIWTSQLNNDIVEDKYIQTVLYSHQDTNDFNPFNDKIIKKKEEDSNPQLLSEYQKGIRIDTDETYRGYGILNGIQSKIDSSGNQIITGIVIDINEILPEYRKKLTDGNMYLQLEYEYGNPQAVPAYDTNQLPKLIVGINNLFTEGYEPVYIINIEENQSYIYHQDAQFNLKNFRYSLVYIQRQQIYTVDKSIGQHQLNKITLDEPFDYNTFHNTNIETGLVSDNFDYGRVYISPVKEFDSKLVPSAYINIAYTTDQLIDTGASGQYVLLSKKPDDWDGSCEKYFYKLDKTYSGVTKEYVELKECPDDWWSDGSYKLYYKVEYVAVSGVADADGNTVAPPWPTDHDSESRNTIYYQYNTTTYSYELIQSQGQPDNWDTNYMDYFIKTDKYTLNTDATWINGLYYKYTAPTFSVGKYYSYGISQTFLSNYTDSLACVQLTNYVAKTGECSLFSDLKFKPDRFYMYQIFIVDQTAPNYDASKSDNPYKYYTGVQISDNGGLEKYCYLGGQRINSYQIDIDIDNNNQIDTKDAELLKMYINNGVLLDNGRLYDYDNNEKVDMDDVEALDAFSSGVTPSLRNLSYFPTWMKNNGYSYNTQQYILQVENVLPIYSNHRIDNTNQYMCFIQPNLGIYEDQYKPCMLQMYNNKYQYDLYITNYNGNNMYNKDYSIDKLDDSQWLVVLTYPTDMSNIETHEQTQRMLEIDSLIYKPQTKYKIYTNFVNSIPEGYFYYRSNKTLEFEYYDFYTQDNLKDLTVNDTGYTDHNGNIIIPRRDIIVKCNIFDSNDPNKLKNLVPIKYYKYTIGKVSHSDITKIDNIIYQSDAIYDGKYQYVIKGLDNYYKIENNTTINKQKKDNPILYRIQITVEDEYDQIYEYAQDVYFGYMQEIVNDRISATSDNYQQAVHIQFAPIKTFSGQGSIVERIEDQYVTIQSEQGLIYSLLQDNADNMISIKKNEDFKFVTRFRINNDMFQKVGEHDVLSIMTDEDENGIADIYTVKLDIRPYVKSEDKYIINDEYLSFKLYKNSNKQSIQSILNIYGNDNEFVMPEQFEYIISTSSQKNKYGIYFIEESSESQVVNNLNGAVDSNNDDVYEMLSQTTEGDPYYVYDNDDNDLNQENINKMTFLFLTINVEDGNTTFSIQADTKG